MLGIHPLAAVALIMVMAAIFVIFIKKELS